MIPSPGWFGAGDGAWGCLMSHMRVAQDAIQDSVANYLVLEDDVVFHPQAKLFLENFLRELPDDWDQLYLGGQFLIHPPEPLSDWVLKAKNVHRTHAYGLNSGCIPTFLNHILQLPEFMLPVRDEFGLPKLVPRDWHLDHQLGRAHEKEAWKTYCPSWWLAGQRAGPSRVSDRETGELWWNWVSEERRSRMPFFFLKSDAGDLAQKAKEVLHFGNSLRKGTLTDEGLDSSLDDTGLERWLNLIAREAIEQWKLPGFQLPETEENLLSRIQEAWSAGVREFDATIDCPPREYPYSQFQSLWEMDTSN
ncbi:MAG: hypothetical protein HKN23_19345 [Verrucomicrobiales bacterium]|nr:hypothetical protein [Verrucomicrobiales bacterium]